MKNRTKVKIAAGVAAALAVAGGGVAIGATGSLSPREESQAVIDDAAAQLGVQPSALSDALEKALENRVDEAVKAGRLTEEQGAALKDRIRSGDTPFIFGGFGHRGFGFGHFGHFGHVGNLDTAATYLGLTEAQLRERLAKGDTLAEIAKTESKSVDGLVQALVKAPRGRIDDAVADGRLTQAQANELRNNLEERITDLVNGELPEKRFGFDRGFGLGFDRFHGGPRS